MINKIAVHTPYRKDDQLYAGNFAYRTWYITHYIARDIKKKKYNYEKVNILNIELENSIEKLEYQKVFNSITLYLKKTSDVLMSLESESFRMAILQIIELSAVQFNKLIPGIYETIIHSTETFAENNYKNIWLFKKRHVKGIGSAKLEAELTPKEFILRLIVETKEAEIHNQEILKTLPDSIFYYHEFKDIKVDDTHIRILNRNDEVVFKLAIKNIGKNYTEKLILENNKFRVFAN